MSNFSGHILIEQGPFVINASDSFTIYVKRVFVDTDDIEHGQEEEMSHLPEYQPDHVYRVVIDGVKTGVKHVDFADKAEADALVVWLHLEIESVAEAEHERQTQLKIGSGGYEAGGIEDIL